MSNTRRPRNAPRGGMSPQLDNGGRWDHIASEQEIARAMRDPDADVCEWEALNKTFVASRRYLTIVRASALGGDTREIEGGWVYRNDIALLLDAHEIKTVGDTTRKHAV